MERNLRNLIFKIGQLDHRFLRLIILILTLALFVIGAGAPGATGDFGG